MSNPDPDQKKINATLAARKAWLTQPLHSTYLDYLSNVHSLIRSLFQWGGSDNLKTVIAESFGDYCKDAITNRTTIDTDLEDTILKMFLEEKYLRLCLQTEYGENGLAWFCTQRAADFQKFNLYDTEHLLSKFLDSWLGCTVSTPSKPTLSEVAGLVYGGHAEALAVLGFTAESNLPYDLARMRYPVFYKQQILSTNQAKQDSLAGIDLNSIP